jgi:hypothetical protein
MSGYLKVPEAYAEATLMVVQSRILAAHDPVRAGRPLAL